MSRSHVRLAAALLLLATASLSSAATAQVMAPMTVQVEPAEQTNKLFFEPNSSGPKQMADEAALAGGSVEIEVPFDSPPFEEAVIRHEWRSGPPSSFPVFLSVTLPDPTFVKLVQVVVNDTPKYSEINGACLRAADTLSRAFEMFFVCRAYALRLEQDGDSIQEAQKSYRAALEGWMKASYRLYVPAECTRRNRQDCTLVTPYGVDPDLIQRLREAIDRGLRAEDWKPLRIADAENLVRYVDQRAIQLAGLVPSLEQRGLVDEANAINESAIAALRTIGPNNDFSITETVLLGNRTLLSAKSR